VRALSLLALIAACNGFDAPGQPTDGAHPISNAGTGSSYPLGTTVALDGTRSFDPDGQLVSYRWSVTQHPDGSTAVPLDPNAATTTFVPDQLGTYRLQLVVDDDDHNRDTSDVRVVATGAVTSIDAGPDATVPWMRTAQLSGHVSTVPGKTATYAWTFVSRPAGSTAAIVSDSTLTPSFVADAAGTYVLALDARVGDEVREDTVTIEATGDGLSLGTGIAVYAYSTLTDRIIYAHDVGHAELVKVDPITGSRNVLNIGAFTPTAITIGNEDQLVGVAGPGKVVTVAVNSFLVDGQQDVPGCTAKAVAITDSFRVACFPVDGTIEPISDVLMSTGQVTQVPCPARSPSVVMSPFDLYMVDGASPDVYVLGAPDTPPLPVVRHWTSPGIVPPVIAPRHQAFAVTGDGRAFNLDGTVLFDLHTPFSAGGFSELGSELALVSGTDLRVFGMEPGQPLKLSAVIPPVNAMPATTKLVAYSADGHRLFIVAGNASGDVVFMVQR
jgi:hypothetical protein